MNAVPKGGWLFLGRAALLLGVVLSAFAAAQGSQTYVISTGDTLETIAKAFDTSVADLKQLNGLTSSALFAGQTLRVPGEQVGVAEHRVVAGDTLGGLAAAYRLPETTLRRANPALDNLSSDARLTVDTLVLVPPGEGEVVALATGESVLTVALRYGVSPAELSRVNALGDLRYVAAGQRVFIPTVVAAPVPTPAPAYTPVPTLAPTPADARKVHLARQRQLLEGAGALLAAYEPAPPGFRWPLQGRVSSGYGRRNVSVGGNTFHGGVDIAAAPGTAVGAARAGVVSRAGWGGAYGYVVFVEHADGSQTRYGHLSQVLTSVGSVLEQGDPLGLVGSTGASTGPHLHFEIRFEGRTVDPLGYLQ